MGRLMLPGLLLLLHKTSAAVQNVDDVQFVIVTKTWSSSEAAAQQTLQTVMAGLYPPSGWARWHPDLKWQPIHNHVYDPMLWMSHVNCPGAKAVWDPIKTDAAPGLAALLRENNDIVSFVRSATGWNASLVEIADIADNLVNLRKAGLSLPSWLADGAVDGYTEEELVERLEAFAGVRERFCATQPACRILTAGHWLNHLGESLAKKYRGLLPRRKMLVYSSNLESVMSVLRLLGQETVEEVPSASGFVLEYRRAAGNTGPASVRLLLLLQQPETFGASVFFAGVGGTCRVGGKPAEWCPLPNFLATIEPFMLPDWRQTCYGPLVPINSYTVDNRDQLREAIQNAPSQPDPLPLSLTPSVKKAAISKSLERKPTTTTTIPTTTTTTTTTPEPTTPSPTTTTQTTTTTAEPTTPEPTTPVPSTLVPTTAAPITEEALVVDYFGQKDNSGEMNEDPLEPLVAASEAFFAPLGAPTTVDADPPPGAPSRHQLTLPPLTVPPLPKRPLKQAVPDSRPRDLRIDTANARATLELADILPSDILPTPEPTPEPELVQIPAIPPSQQRFSKGSEEERIVFVSQPKMPDDELAVHAQHSSCTDPRKEFIDSGRTCGRSCSDHECIQSGPPGCYCRAPYVHQISSRPDSGCIFRALCDAQQGDAVSLGGDEEEDIAPDAEALHNLFQQLNRTLDRFISFGNAFGELGGLGEIPSLADFNLSNAEPSEPVPEPQPSSPPPSTEIPTTQPPTTTTEEVVPSTESIEEVIANPCNLPKDLGLCLDEETESEPSSQWYWNAEKGQCLAFAYSGCGGNANRFSSRSNCQLSCAPQDGAVCSGRAGPLRVGGRAKLDRNCAALRCPPGWQCTMGWRFASCCNSSIESEYAAAFAERCPDGRAAFAIFNGEYDEHFFGDDCASLACPNGFSCLQINRRFAKCCAGEAAAALTSEISAEDVPVLEIPEDVIDIEEGKGEANSASLKSSLEVEAVSSEKAVVSGTMAPPEESAPIIPALPVLQAPSQPLPNLPPPQRNGILHLRHCMDPKREFQICGSACPPACSQLLRPCTLRCVSGCFCRPGLVLSDPLDLDSPCVPPALCNAQKTPIRLRVGGILEPEELLRRSSALSAPPGTPALPNEEVAKLSSDRSASGVHLTFLSESRNPPAPPPNKPCRDEEPLRCRVWAFQGECKENPFWMKIHCQKTCRCCGCTPAALLSPQFLQGECKENPFWMKIHCQKTCRCCGCTPAALLSPQFLQGECKENPFWMKIHCQKTCRCCGCTPAALLSPQFLQGECKENPFWMKIHCQKTYRCCGCTPAALLSPQFLQGECKENPFWMKIHCQKTCRCCGCTPAALLSPQFLQGECKENPFWMKIHCQKTCRCCGCTPAALLSPQFLQGECKENPFWMKIHCQKTCRCCGCTPAALLSPQFLQGECKENPFWMKIHCQKTCRCCGCTPAALLSPQFLQGECKENPFWMKIHCQKTCRCCGCTPAALLSPQFLQGECKENPFWMKIHCQKTCRCCGCTPAALLSPQFLQGECKENPFWMKIHCQKTCRCCGCTPAALLSPQFLQGECKENPFWMKIHCQKTCRCCGCTPAALLSPQFLQGECKENPFWMKIHCQKTCRCCGCTPAALLSPQFLQGECKENPFWMKIHCQKTCRCCGCTPAALLSLQFLQGECKENPFWMKIHCQKTCRCCGCTPAALLSPQFLQGECKENPFWMKIHCQKTCRCCGCTPAALLSPQFLQGECKENPFWMKIHCQKTCRCCGCTPAALLSPQFLQGECKENPFWMKIHCQKTCRCCGCTPAALLSPQFLQGECKENPFWMKIHCQKTCRCCGCTPAALLSPQFLQGECKENPFWMKIHCQKTCRCCGCTPAALLSPQFLQGECKENPFWMKIHCQKTCRCCGCTPAALLSLQFLQGECKENPFWMKIHCQKTCRCCGCTPAALLSPQFLQGECKENPFWMKIHCQKTCRCCGCTPAALLSPQFLQGECKENPFWMKIHCQKTCRCCGCTPAALLSPQFLQGECKENPFWMKIHCQKTCRCCGCTPAALLSLQFLQGECKENPFWMKIHCQKTCRCCGCTPAALLSPQFLQDCEDLNDHCSYWADGGHCSSNPGYMGHFCRASCRLCNPLFKKL